MTTLHPIQERMNALASAARDANTALINLAQSYPDNRELTGWVADQVSKNEAAVKRMFNLKNDNHE